MKKIIYSISLFLMASGGIMLSGCGSGHDGHDHQHEGDHHHETNMNETHDAMDMATGEISVTDCPKWKEGPHQHAAYVCPMWHEAGESDSAGDCPECGMKLVPFSKVKEQHEKQTNNN